MTNLAWHLKQSSFIPSYYIFIWIDQQIIVCQLVLQAVSLKFREIITYQKLFTKENVSKLVSQTTIFLQYILIYKSFERKHFFL